MLVRRHGGEDGDPGLLQEASQVSSLMALQVILVLLVAIPELGAFPWLRTRCTVSMMFLTFIRDRTLGLNMSTTPARWIWVCAPFVLVVCGAPLRGRVDLVPQA
jgi:hypothetical protein